MITNARTTIARAPQRPNFAIPKALCAYSGENRHTNMQSICLKLCGAPLYDLVITAMVIQVRS